MCSAGGDQGLPGRVAPFGYHRLGLLDSSPMLFAVLPRPSSALNAKASTVCSYYLTCFRIDINCYIQLLKCGRQKKRSGGFPPDHEPSGSLPPALADYFSAFFICKDKCITRPIRCQHRFEAEHGFFHYIFKIY
jgi:hypothetical protein